MMVWRQVQAPLIDFVACCAALLHGLLRFLLSSRHMGFSRRSIILALLPLRGIRSHTNTLSDALNADQCLLSLALAERAMTPARWRTMILIIKHNHDEAASGASSNNCTAQTSIRHFLNHAKYRFQDDNGAGVSLRIIFPRNNSPNPFSAGLLWDPVRGALDAPCHSWGAQYVVFGTFVSFFCYP